MTLDQVRQIQPGDQVFWNDPDEGTCSRVLTVQTIEINVDSEDDGEDMDIIVSIMEPGGSVVECYAHELS